MISLTTILEAKNLTIGYKRGNKILKSVHNNLSFKLRTGELTCLLGPNGAGKSTLLRTLGVTQHSLSGEIILDGKPLKKYSVKNLSQKIGLVLTEKTFAGALRVKELVALGRHPHTGFFGRLSSYDYAIVEKAMADTGITEKKDAFIAELSDGERQKAMIAKALAQESPLIILDEPTSFLDIISRIEIMHLLRDLAKNQQKAILLSTHDLEQALMVSDQLWLLSKENGLCCGNPEDLIFSGAIDKLFNHRHIKLDKLSGNFRREREIYCPIKLKADPEFIFWTRNLLNRHGYDIAKKEDESNILLEISGKSDMKITTSLNKDYSFHSFKELDQFFCYFNI